MASLYHYVTFVFYSNQNLFFMLTKENLILVALGNTSLSNCTFESGFQYCGKYYVEDATMSTDTDDSGEDTIAPDSLTEDEGCTDYVDVCSGCGWDCSTILELYEITISQFFEWNPLVGSECTGMQLGKQ